MRNYVLGGRSPESNFRDDCKKSFWWDYKLRFPCEHARAKKSHNYAHVKDPVVCVSIQWIVETPDNAAFTERPKSSDSWSWTPQGRRRRRRSWFLGTGSWVPHHGQPRQVLLQLCAVWAESCRRCDLLGILCPQADVQAVKRNHGKPGERVEKAAELLMGCFRVCASDKWVNCLLLGSCGLPPFYLWVDAFCCLNCLFNVSALLS